jgi:hypothetical protein
MRWLVMVKTAVVALYLNRGLPGSAVYNLSTGRQEARNRYPEWPPVRQSFQFKLFGCKRLRHLHRAIDVSAEIWNHSVALKNRYYKLSMLMTSEFVF